MPDSVKAMCRSGPELEERVFQMLGTDLTTPEMAAALGISPQEALPIVLKVIHERGTPALAGFRRQIEILSDIHFV